MQSCLLRWLFRTSILRSGARRDKRGSTRNANTAKPQAWRAPQLSPAMSANVCFSAGYIRRNSGYDFSYAARLNG
jgi:hypothetical protein